MRSSLGREGGSGQEEVKEERWIFWPRLSRQLTGAGGVGVGSGCLEGRGWGRDEEEGL